MLGKQWPEYIFPAPKSSATTARIWRGGQNRWCLYENEVWHPSLPSQRVLVRSTSCHTIQAVGVHKGLAIDDHWQRGLFFFWCQAVVEAGGAGWHPRPGSVRVGVSLVRPGEKAGMLCVRMRALGECVQQNREEGTTTWQHCIWCVGETARVKRA